MGRVPDLSSADLTPDQQRLAEEIAQTRNGAVAGPFALWLRLPALADKANQFDNQLRLQGSLEKRFFELAVLVVARAWTAQYEWFAHAESARQAGIDDQNIEAIRTGGVPHFKREDEQTIYNVAREIAFEKNLSDTTYGAALQFLGLNQLIELVTVIGFYTLVATMVKSFDCPVPGGAQPLPNLALNGHSPTT